jgi:hypothetical protein
MSAPSAALTARELRDLHERLTTFANSERFFEASVRKTTVVGQVIAYGIALTAVLVITFRAAWVAQGTSAPVSTIAAGFAACCAAIGLVAIVRLVRLLRTPTKATAVVVLDPKQPADPASPVHSHRGNLVSAEFHLLAMHPDGSRHRYDSSELIDERAKPGTFGVIFTRKDVLIDFVPVEPL